MTTKRFPVRVLLTVTTERLLTQPQCENNNGIGDLYDILGHMTGESPFTHQLPRFNQECRPWLLRWFPELAAVSERLGNLDILLGEVDAELGPRANVIEKWLQTEQERCGLKDFYDVPQIPQDDHEHKDPYDELVAELGSDEKVIVVDTTKE
jgi:hypothetical protein